MTDFINIADHSAEELHSILQIAADLKREWQRGGNSPQLRDKVLAMIFQKPSLRTRVSFDMAMRHLGGDALYLSPDEIGLGERESIADVARVTSGYVSAIMARVFDHQHVVELARWSDIPVINGLSDYNHPCQALADAFTMREHFGSLEGLNVSFIGDGNNVAVSLMHICAKVGANFTIANPEGYDMPQRAIEAGQGMAQKSGSTITLLHDPQQGAKEADVIYTDTWISMGQSDEAQKRRQVFPPYQVNRDLVSLARDEAIVMHCLPAHRGEEITDDVADGPQSIIFQQAHNRMHAQKGLLVHLLA